MHPDARTVLYGTAPIAMLVLGVGVACGCHLLEWGSIGFAALGLSMALSLDYFAPDPDAEA